MNRVVRPSSAAPATFPASEASPLRRVPDADAPALLDLILKLMEELTALRRRVAALEKVRSIG